MSDLQFFAVARPIPVSELAEICGAEVASPGRDGLAITGTAPLDRAGPTDLIFLDNPRYASQLSGTRAGACLVAAKNRHLVPDGVATLIAADPYVAFARAAAALFPESQRPQSMFGGVTGVSHGAMVHPDSRLEVDVSVDPGAVIGAGAEIGSNTIVGAGAVIGPKVRIGRDCSIGAGCSITNALIGDRVIIQPGARIGQDGFGFAMGKRHLKVPQLGRVVIQDDVEIGSCTTIDRGSNRETIIGEGTKIDNLCQIAHNVVIGRHCVIVSQVGISGSTTIGDYAVLAGKAGVVGHVRIGAGAQIAASANVIGDVPAGARWGGHIARPMREWLREAATLRRLARRAEPASEAGERKD